MNQVTKLRERFEVWASIHAPGHSRAINDSGQYADYATECAWAGWHAALTADASDQAHGAYVLVPAEPTEEMLAAICQVKLHPSRVIYSAMLAARPAPVDDAPAVEPVAWALLNECDPQVTTDSELAHYWGLKGRDVTALYAAPDRAPSTDSATELDEDDSPPGYERRRFNREGV